MAKGVIKFQDVGGKRGIMRLGNVKDEATLKQFANEMDSFSNCKVTSYCLIATPKTDMTATDATTGNLPNKDQKLICTWSYVDGGESKVFRLAIPAPDDDVIVNKGGTGWLLKKASGDAIGAMLKTLTGKNDATFTFLGSSESTNTTQPQPVAE